MTRAPRKRASTTPEVRAAIQASTEPARVLAERYGISEPTVWKWRKRDNVQDRSRKPHRLQTTLTPAQEALVVVLRKTLLLPLDDLLALVREFINPAVSRSGLDRCLRRHGVSRLRPLLEFQSASETVLGKQREPGELHVHLASLQAMSNAQREQVLLFAVDHVTRWVFVRTYTARTPANARRFLRDLRRAAPMQITRMITGRCKEFSASVFDPLGRIPTANHEFDQLCAELGIEGRQTTHQGSDEGERSNPVNSRIDDVLQVHHFRSTETLNEIILRYVSVYNAELTQSVLDGHTPLDTLRQWQRKRPELFKVQEAAEETTRKS